MQSSTDSVSQICRTILIVEDDHSIRETLKDLLESEGFSVVTAENGLEGVERIKQYPHTCLVLLDMMMPIMDGREFLDVIQADPEVSHIPVLVVSATVTSETSRGAQGVIKKPIELDFLLKMINEHAA